MPKINPTNMLPAGTLLEGRYRIERYLSSGGCGNTYLAKDTKFSGKKGRVVVKEFFLNGITHRDQHTSRVIVSNQDNAALFEKLRRKFREEADRINELKHPNIVRVSDVFDANHTSYYVMDFISGGSLDQRAGQLTEQQAVKYTRQVLQALDVVHEEGLYHLDLKPANVMLDKYDNAILIDFGASKMISGPDGNTLSSTILYTKGYAPAEQMYRDLELIGPWTDLYAVGATLYNLLTGQQPPSPSVLQMKKEAALPMEGANEGVRAFVLHCMRPDISDRPHSVAEALYELNHTNPSDRCIGPEFFEVNSEADSSPDTPPADSNQQKSDAPQAVPKPLFELDEKKDTSTLLIESEPIAPTEDQEEINIVVYEEMERHKDEKHSNKWLYVIIPFLLVIVVGLGAYLYLSNKENSLKDYSKESHTDSSTVFESNELEDSIFVDKESDIKVEGYKVIGNSEDLNYRLCVNVNGQLVTTKDLLDGYIIAEILDEHDYDGDGKNECLVFTSLGGSSSPAEYRVVYYNAATDKIEDVMFDSYIKPTPVKQNDRWQFSVKDGINTSIFIFEKGKIKKVVNKNKKISKSLTTYSFTNVFGMEEIEEEEKNIFKKFDIDDDGNLETLVFHSNQSHLFDWGRAMMLTIIWNDDRDIEIQMTAKKIAIISSKSNGLHDILLGDKYLFKWNGKDYVEVK
ncbi:MAG: serine/threonine protein kinase [Bacteroidaceae bacterium]|nr:serine/threonine protein kinase [Bacteroidaceae bacterium]